MEASKNLLFGVLGLGISGLATVQFMLKHGYRFIAWDDDEKSVEMCRAGAAFKADLTKPDDSIWKEVDVLVASPGISNLKAHQIVRSLKHKAKVTCDIQLFYDHFPNNKYIAVTGTNGKSTTSSLIAHILNYGGIKARACGNIGVPILSVIPEENEVLVLEMSSYQLDLMSRFKPNVAVITNITPDHLDRYGSFEKYVHSKARIFRDQASDDYLVLNIDDLTLVSFTKQLKPQLVPVSTQRILPNGNSLIHNVIHDAKRQRQIQLNENKNLRGKHNADNIICSYSAVTALKDLKPDVMKNAIATYPGLKHRMQVVGELDGMEFINDSKATNAESAQKALETLFGEIYWIAGGLPKSGGIDSIKDTLKKKVKQAFLVGQAQKEFAQTLAQCGIPYAFEDTLDVAFDAAVKAMQQNSSKEKILLLSPACASLDQWKNFEERGEHFIKLTKNFLSRVKSS
jgi:UDP-N-acetylmuramoylalanine--D-glutamate ligase